MQFKNKIKIETDSLYSIFYSFFSIIATIIVYANIYYKTDAQNLTNWIILLTIINFPGIIEFFSGDSLSKIIAREKKKKILINCSYYLVSFFYLILSFIYFLIIYLNLIQFEIFLKFKYLIYINIILLGFNKLDSYILDATQKIKFKSKVNFIAHFLFLSLVFIFLKIDNFEILLYFYTLQNIITLISFRIKICRKYPIFFKNSFKYKNFYKKIFFAGLIFNFQKITKDIYEPIIKFLLILFNLSNNILIFDLAMKILKSFDLLVYSFSRPYNYFYAKKNSISKLKEHLNISFFLVLLLLFLLIVFFITLYLLLPLIGFNEYQQNTKDLLLFLVIIFSTYSLGLIFYPINFYAQIKKSHKYNIIGNIIILFISIVLIYDYNLNTVFVISFLVGYLFMIYKNFILIGSHKELSFSLKLKQYLIFLLVMLFLITVFRQIL